ncbi:hypothetical protein IB286_04680 [Spongiibacter sp. KMU-158]|uniref:Uncharacterized protein n=1 Tax=Spongiibacter pelagi TaxID=2760804 RepID=A0A927C280_9GAMM|nr:hypothetical protein [Spongiibacter pelagi]MBD2858296.1 hypothetical protein [Spongiibacter pelagi]
MRYFGVLKSVRDEKEAEHIIFSVSEGRSVNKLFERVAISFMALLILMGSVQASAAGDPHFLKILLALFVSLIAACIVYCFISNRTLYVWGSMYNTEAQNFGLRALAAFISLAFIIFWGLGVFSVSSNT